MSELGWFKFDYPDLPYEYLEHNFRLLAKNPKAHFDYELMMSYDSLREGLIKHFYDGKANPIIHELIFFYFSRGYINTEVSYYKFMSSFILELIQDPNKFIFKLLDEN